MEPLRASDAEREEVADFLRERCLEGRLEPDELDDRLSAALGARTRGELVALVKDQPGGDTVLAPPGAVSIRGAGRPARRARQYVVPALVLAALVLVLVPLLVPPELVLVAFVGAVMLTIIGGALLVTLAPWIAAGAGAVWAVRRLQRRGDERRELPGPG